MTGRSRAPVVLALLFVVAGCGAAQMQPAGEPPTSNLDVLEQRLSRQEAVIQARLGPSQPQSGKALDRLEQRPAVGGAEASEPAQPAPPPAAAPPPEAPAGKDETASAPPQSAAESESAGSTCDLVCRALASMRRSADRICEIVGKESPRCTKARGRVDDATRRVEGAGCSCSG